MMFGFGKKQGFDKMALLPLVSSLGDFLKKGFDQYVAVRSQGKEFTKEQMETFLSFYMGSWNPEFKGKALLDDETRKAAIAFVAGVALNMAKEN